MRFILFFNFFSLIVTFSSSTKSALSNLNILKHGPDKKKIVTMTQFLLFAFGIQGNTMVEPWTEVPPVHLMPTHGFRVLAP